MKQFSLLLTLVITSVLFAQTDKRLKGLTEELNTVLEATKAPGFAIAVVEGEKIIYAKGFGYRDIENKITTKIQDSMKTPDPKVIEKVVEKVVDFFSEVFYFFLSKDGIVYFFGGFAASILVFFF